MVLVVSHSTRSAATLKINPEKLGCNRSSVLKRGRHGASWCVMVPGLTVIFNFCVTMNCRLLVVMSATPAL